MTTPIEAGYPKDAERGTGDTGGQFVTQDSSKSQPAPKPQPKAAPKGKPQVQHKPAPKKPAPKPGPAARPPGPPGSPRLNLKRGGKNDAGEVRNLQALLSGLKVGNIALDGQFGPGTEAAVKAAQAKLGMRPTGRASSALIHKLADAHALSPCVNKVAAAEDVTAKFDPHQPRGHDGKWSLVDALKALGGHDDEQLNPAAGGYADWSTRQDNGIRSFEFGDADGNAVSLMLDVEETQQLSRALTLTQLHAHNPADAAHPHTALLHAMGAHGDVQYVDGSYLDWSSINADGTRSLEIGDGADAVSVDLTPAEFAEFQASVALTVMNDANAGSVTAAAGHDTMPGNDELHHYWTQDPEGLAKWRDSPTPWTALVAHLTKHVGPEKAKVFASKWHKEVFGIWVGEKAGKNPHGPG